MMQIGDTGTLQGAQIPPCPARVVDIDGGVAIIRYDSPYANNVPGRCDRHTGITMSGLQSMEDYHAGMFYFVGDPK